MPQVQPLKGSGLQSQICHIWGSEEGIFILSPAHKCRVSNRLVHWLTDELLNCSIIHQSIIATEMVQDCIYCMVPSYKTYICSEECWWSGLVVKAVVKNRCHCVVHLLLKTGLKMHQRTSKFQKFWGGGPQIPPQWEGDTPSRALPHHMRPSATLSDSWPSANDFKSTYYFFWNVGNTVYATNTRPMSMKPYNWYTESSYWTMQIEMC